METDRLSIDRKSTRAADNHVVHLLGSLNEVKGPTIDKLRSCGGQTDVDGVTRASAQILSKWGHKLAFSVGIHWLVKNVGVIQDSRP